MFSLLKTYLGSLPKTKKGQAMVEYGLIIALIAVVVLGVLGTLGGQIQTMFQTVSDKLAE